jgi:hypothetical protein
MCRQELESLLQQSLKHVTVVDEDKKLLTKKLDLLFEYCDGLNKSLLAKESISKLQEEKIQKLLEQAPLVEVDLQKEIDALRLCIETNPEVQRLKIENLELMGMLVVLGWLIPS